MANQNFQSLGGINQKASQADLNVMEFLDISNFDFTTTGALQQRPGSATFLYGPALNQTQIISVNGQTLFNSLGLTAVNYNTFFYTLTVTTGATVFNGIVSSLYEFQNLQGASFLVFSAPGGFSYSSSALISSFSLNQVYFITGSTYGYLLDPLGKVISSSNYPINKNWSFTNFVNRLFFANGDNFYKWDGYTATVSYESDGASNVPTSFFQSVPSTYKFCLPPGSSLFSTVGYLSGVTTAGYTGFNSATYTYSYGFINDRGFLGPVSPYITVGISMSYADSSHMIIFPPAVTVFGFSGFYASGASLTPTLSIAGFSLYDGYGIGTSTITSYLGISTVTNTTYGTAASVAVYRDNGPGTGRYLIGFASAFGTQVFAGYTGTGPFTLAYYVNIQPQGFAQSFGDIGIATSNIPEPTCIFATLPPQFLEIFNNQLFMAGFSQAPSTVQFSDIGQPESIQPENNFEVRTNDGDVLTGMKAAFGNLYFFKNRSFHQLSGTDPTNFVLSPVSDQYGCISSRAIATFENQMMFLDKKGIISYNGAMVQVASSKIDPIFANMNLQVAEQNAWMLHNKQRNQVWCGIPVNGSTLINQIIVYDYLLNAWTHFDGIYPSCAIPGYGTQSLQTVYFGGYSSTISYFGPSLTSDYGNAITLMAKSRFIGDMGQSVEKMWRRLFINQISALGYTIGWNINFFTDYQSSVNSTIMMSGQTFQVRSDFGIPSKALSIQFYTNTASDILQFQGFVLSSRFQRNQ